MSTDRQMKCLTFQSTLPCGSDNKRNRACGAAFEFQSTLPCGSDPTRLDIKGVFKIFQSTLPCGSDVRCALLAGRLRYFNPRSLAGATAAAASRFRAGRISIHAPLRERRFPHRRSKALRHFNPRSLAGATFSNMRRNVIMLFQSTLPCGSDSVKMKYFYNYVNQAFVANKLNLNSKRFYFDVRKYKLSHTSLSCEPKLNLWFIYLRNTKIPVYKLPPPTIHFKSYACSLRLQAIFPPPLPLHNHYSFWQ